jgi:hypothetical protein
VGCQDSTRTDALLVVFAEHSYEDPLKQTDEIKAKLDQNLEVSTDVQTRLARLEDLLTISQPRSPPLHRPPFSQQHNAYRPFDHDVDGQEKDSGPGLKGRITQGSYFGTSAMATVEQPGPLDHGDDVRTIPHLVPLTRDIALIGCDYVQDRTRRRARSTGTK